MLSLAGAHTTPPLATSPPTTVPIAPPPSLITSVKKQIQTSKEWLNNLSRLKRSRPSKNHVSIFMAEAETQIEEDLLFQFRNWTTEEEEREEYQTQFLRNYWTRLPRDIQRHVRVMFCKSMYRQRYPFGIRNAPARFQNLIANSHRSASN